MLKPKIIIANFKESGGLIAKCENCNFSLLLKACIQKINPAFNPYYLAAG